MTAPALFRCCAAVLLLGACNATSTTVAGAVVNTGIAASVSAVRRAEGDCYTPCTPGNACNRASGLCERVPCGGQCQPGEQCEESWTGEVRCVAPSGLAIQRAVPARASTSAAPVPPVARVPAPAAAVSPAAVAPPPERPAIEMAKPVPQGSSAPSDAKLPAPSDDQPPPR